MKRIVLAYAGDPASTIALHWLHRQDDVEVVTVTLDLGQGPDLAAVRERALAVGAVRAHVIDARDEFARDFLLPALQAGAFIQAGAFLDDALLSVAIARALIARRLVELAHMESASAVAHGSTPGNGTGHLLDAAIRALDPTLEIIVPARSAALTGEGLALYGRGAGIPLPLHEGPWVDANLWARTIGLEGGAEPDEETYRLTRAPEDAPDGAAYLDLELLDGVPVRTNGVEMSFNELIESVETIAGAHGVGRRRVPHAGCIVEAPAAAVLAVAHAAIEASTLGADLVELKRQLSAAYVRHVSDGRWFSDGKAAIDAFVRVTERRVTGMVRLRLLKGRCEVVEQHSPNNVTSGPRPSSRQVA